jgi:hypothetical protein
MKYHQGRFIPRNPGKYVGDVANIIFRSSWEAKLFNWLDLNPSILKWFSEELVIPYVSPADNRLHRYFVDVGMEYKTSNGEIKRAIIEVKPEKQTKMPQNPRRNTQKYLNEVTTYSINQAKWKAADAWAKKNGWEFHILTERHLRV